MYGVTDSIMSLIQRTGESCKKIIPNVHAKIGVQMKLITKFVAVNFNLKASPKFLSGICKNIKYSIIMRASVIISLAFSAMIEKNGLATICRQWKITKI